MRKIAENNAKDDAEEALFDRLITAQKQLLLACGRKFIDTLTPEDMLQPNDYDELENSAIFRYEEGVLAGLQTAQMALRALRRDGITSTNNSKEMP